MTFSNLNYDKLLPQDWFSSCELDFSVEDSRSFYKVQQKLKKGKIISSSQQSNKGNKKHSNVVKTIEFRYRTPREFNRIIDDLVLLGLSEIQIRSIQDDFFNSLAVLLNTKSPVPS